MRWLGRSRNDRRFPPLGVKKMPPYRWNGYNVAMFTQPFHDFDTRNAFLSEGGALAVVVGDFPETPRQTRDNRDFPCLRLARPSLARRSCAPHERGAGGESDPRFLDAGASSARVSRSTPQFTVNLPSEGVSLTTVIPSGRLVRAGLLRRAQPLLLGTGLVTVDYTESRQRIGEFV